MANVLDGLLSKIDDPSLQTAIAEEVERLRDTKQFGLVFERHLPETAKLTNHPVRRDALVQRRGQGDQPSGVVQSVSEQKATVAWESGETEHVPTNELVVVARFGEPIYPGLRSLGRIERGGDKPCHTVINAENYHALQMLQFTHRNAVDVIYIDPPYNTGKKAEWRYNDRWVSSDDAFRHSKWLSFMDRRLRLARDLLRGDGLLLISIDDNELHHLRCLCDSVFGEDRWLATFVWRTDGNIDNQAKIKTNHEYIVCLSPSPDDFSVSATIDPNIRPDSKLRNPEIRNSVVKNGPKNPVSEIEIPAGFPASFDEGTIPARDDKWPKFDEDIVVAEGKTTRPVKVRSGWANASMMTTFIDHGFRPVLDRKGQETAFEFTHTGAIENVKKRASDQSHVLSVLYNMGTTELTSNELTRMGVSFTYPKPLPLLRYLIGLHANPDAVVLDFFVGSGSTAQAVMELNAADDGRRQCIAVTNNEVAEKQAKKLSKKGLMPGDPEWEQWGLFEHVTRPRIETLVTGKRPDGSKYSDGMDENVEFFELTYQDPNRVARGRAFSEVAPLLWMIAGGTGPRIEEACDSYAAPAGSTYAVLFDPAYIRELAGDLDARTDITTVFIVTDSTAAYQQAVAELPAHVEPVRLYAAYLHNFEIHTGDDL